MLESQASASTPTFHFDGSLHPNLHQVDVEADVNTSDYDKGTSFIVVADTLDGDADDEFEDNDEDLNENYEYFQFLDYDYEQYEQERANEEVNVDDHDFDKYVVHEGAESSHKEPGEASSDEYHCNSEDLRSLSEEEEHDEVERVKKTYP
ncbi:hypothetical protein L3X38_036535 [Prunus dulcis]|uniref:Transcription factor Iwr1 domain-containing protein n=1 Tax=Prunus dulcis TaxID=3755 RepID=A0AAD4V2Q8_PRUDU|nr:hypothetical protein L3X38_036535 [Prunus dulcis]